MNKISHQQVQTLLKTASTTIRALQSEKDDLQAKVAGFEKKERAEKIAADMEEKGLHADLSFSEKVAHLLDGERVKDLTVAEEAVKMAAPNVGVLGSVTDQPGSGLSPFELYIATGEEEP